MSYDSQIKSRIKSIYLSDIEAIRLFSNFAIEFSNGNGNIQNNINLLGILDLGAGHTTREGNAGKIGYGTIDTNALNIVGKGIIGVKRNVRVYDDLYVDSNLIVGNECYIGSSNLIVGNNQNVNKQKWIFHPPNDDSGKLYIARIKDDGTDWNWGNALIFDGKTGTLTLKTLDIRG